MKNRTLKDSFKQMLKKIEQVKENTIVNNKIKVVKIVTRK